MPIWLMLIVLGGGGYLAYEAFFRQKYPEGIASPAAEAIFDQVKAAEVAYDAAEVDAETLDTRLQVISDNQRVLREAEQMTMAEYNLLQDYKVALWGKAGIL